MKIAYGLKAHSGWAALVALGLAEGEFLVVDRRRLELVEEEWAKQPYHAAEELKPEAARKLVKRGIDSAFRIAMRELKVTVSEQRQRGNEVIACGVLVGNPMPEWSVEQILAVHFRMHQAEGVLFRDALVYAAKECGVRVLEVPEKTLSNCAEQSLAISASDLSKTLTTLGKLAGPPWGKDQKEAALAAMIALSS